MHICTHTLFFPPGHISSLKEMWEKSSLSFLPPQDPGLPAQCNLGNDFSRANSWGGWGKAWVMEHEVRAIGSPRSVPGGRNPAKLPGRSEKLRGCTSLMTPFPSWAYLSEGIAHKTGTSCLTFIISTFFSTIVTLGIIFKELDPF